MGDPLSISASVVALLQLTQVLIDYGASVQKASEEQQRLREEVKYLHHMLKLLEIKVNKAKTSGSSATDTWHEHVKALGGDNGPLEQLRQLLKRLENKFSKTKLLWYFSKREVEESLSGIERIKSLIQWALFSDLNDLTLAVKSDTSGLMQRTERLAVNFAGIQQSMDDQLKRTLSDWLGLSSRSKNYLDVLRERQPATGLWLTQGALSEGLKYENWKSSTSSSLWLHGKAGCGKTVLSAIVLEDIRRNIQNDPDCFVSHFFFDFSNNENQTWKKALRSLTFQFCLKLPRCFEALKTHYDACQIENQPPSEEKILPLLFDCLQSDGHKYVLLDALDECNDRNDLLDFLEDLITRRLPGVHLIVTSRKLKDIQDQIESKVDHKIDVQNSVIENDIRTYIGHRLCNDPRLKKWPTNIRDEISQELMEKADGMFRWVYCQLEALKQCRRLPELKKAMASLPKTLDGTYDRMLSQIEDNGDLECAIWILKWLCFSPHPLRLTELNEIQAISSGKDGGFDPTLRLPDLFDIMEICSSLISCIHYGEEGYDYKILNQQKLDSDIEGLASNSSSPHFTQVRLAHYSVKEYLLSDRSPIRTQFHADESHQQMAEGCLHYLLHVCQNAPLTEDLKADHALCQYAAKEWPTHARAMTGQLSESIIDSALCLLFDRRSYLVMWEELRFPGLDFDGDVDPPMITACDLDLADLVLQAVARGAEVDARDTQEWTALHLASSRGSEKILSSLLAGGADTETRDNLLNTPLHKASLKGHEKIVRRLLDAGAHLDVGGYRGWTALHNAVSEGNANIVQLLIDRGADIQAGDDDGWTALHEASSKGREDMVEMLLDKGAQTEVRDGDGYTPLQRAVSDCQEKIVRLLLASGADIEARDDSGDTVLHYLCSHTNAMVPRLLSNKFVFEAKSNAESSSHRMMQILLENNADTEARTSEEATALIIASCYGSVETVQLLLKHGADLEAKDQSDFRSIHEASLRGHKDIVQILLDAGADMNARSTSGETPLDLAQRNNHEKIAQMLKDRGAVVSFIGNERDGNRTCSVIA